MRSHNSHDVFSLAPLSKGTIMRLHKTFEEIPYFHARVGFELYGLPVNQKTCQLRRDFEKKFATNWIKSEKRDHSSVTGKNFALMPFPVRAAF